MRQFTGVRESGGDPETKRRPVSSAAGSLVEDFVVVASTKTRRVGQWPASP